MSGLVLTFVVNDVELYYKKAMQFGMKIIQKPTNLLYGQRRLLIEEPSGALIDISSPY